MFSVTQRAFHPSIYCFKIVACRKFPSLKPKNCFTITLAAYLQVKDHIFTVVKRGFMYSVTLHLYQGCLQIYPREREAHFSTRRCIIQQCQSWQGPLARPLGVLWLNGIVGCTLLGFLISRLVYRAARGQSLGHMTTQRAYLLWWLLFQLLDFGLPL